MEDSSQTLDDPNAAAVVDPNAVTMLQRRHSQPLTSHQTYLYPAVQPKSSSEARGENPWTGQTADEVREAAYSEQQYRQQQQQLLLHQATKARSERAGGGTRRDGKGGGANGGEKTERARDLAEMMFHTAM